MTQQSFLRFDAVGLYKLTYRLEARESFFHQYLRTSRINMPSQCIKIRCWPILCKAPQVFVRRYLYQLIASLHRRKTLKKEKLGDATLLRAPPATDASPPRAGGLAAPEKLFREWSQRLSRCGNVFRQRFGRSTRKNAETRLPQVTLHFADAGRGDLVESERVKRAWKMGIRGKPKRHSRRRARSANRNGQP